MRRRSRRRRRILHRVRTEEGHERFPLQPGFRIQRLEVKITTLHRQLPRLPLTRRHFLQALAGAGAFGSLSRFAGAFPAAQAVIPFEEVPPSVSGISWKHTAGKSPEKYLPETTGAGCAFLDYDNDGWMDLYFVNSGACDFYTPNPPLRNALYHNNRDGTFTDVTEKAGVGAPGWASSAVWFDYDNDGRLDLFVCRFVDFNKAISKDCHA